MLRLGPSGANLYFCTDYMSPQHADADVAWALCCQLAKNGVGEDEYNFCYTKWQVYLRTEPRAVW